MSVREPGRPSDEATETPKLDVNQVRPRAQATGPVIIKRGAEQKLLIEIEAEIDEARLDNLHRRQRENRLFNVLIVLGGILVAVCLIIIFSNIVPAFGQTIRDSERQWAQTMLAALFTGIVGYLTGRAQK